MPTRRTSEAIPLQLLDDEGRTICRGWGTLWRAAAGPRDRWGGEFFQFAEGLPPKGVGRGLLRTPDGERFPIVTGGLELRQTGATWETRLRFGGADGRCPACFGPASDDID